MWAVWYVWGMSSRNKSQALASREASSAAVHIEQVIQPRKPTDIEVDPAVSAYLVTTLGETGPTSVRTWRVDPKTLRVRVDGSEVTGLMLVPVS